MNLRWFRNNLVSLIAGELFVALLSTMLWFLREAYVQQDTVLAELATQNTELDNLRNYKPFPSKENIDLINRDRENIRQLYEAMRGAATFPLLHGPNLTRDIDFLQFKQATVNHLTEMVVPQHIRAPEAFGFSRYDAKFPCRNPVARGEDCLRLMALLSKQLVTVEKLVTLLVSNQVEEIMAIRRVEVEPGEVSTDALTIPGGSSSNALYQTYPFELQFTCDTPVLRDLLNGLMQTDALFVIRTLRIDTASVTLKSLEMPTGNGEVAAGRSAEPLGEVRKRRLTVALRLDLVEFAPPPAAPKPRGGRE